MANMIDANSPFLSVPVDGRSKGENPRKTIEFSGFSLGAGASDGKPDSAAIADFAEVSIETGPDKPNFAFGTVALVAIDSATQLPSGDSIRGQLHSGGENPLPVSRLENLKRVDAARDALPAQVAQELNGVGDASRIAPGQLPGLNPRLNVEGTEVLPEGNKKIVVENAGGLPNDMAREANQRLAPYPPNGLASSARAQHLTGAMAQERRGTAGDRLMDSPPNAAKTASPPTQGPLLQPSLPSSLPPAQPSSRMELATGTRAASRVAAALVLNDLDEGADIQKPSTADYLRSGYTGRSASTAPSGRATISQIRPDGRPNPPTSTIAREVNQGTPLAEQAPLASTVNKLKMTDGRNPLDADGVVALQKLPAATLVEPPNERKILAANLKTSGVATKEKSAQKPDTIDLKSPRSRLDTISVEPGSTAALVSWPTRAVLKTVAASPPTDQRLVAQVQGAVGQWVVQELERDNPNSKLFESKSDGALGWIENRVMTQSGLPVRGAPTQHPGAVPRAVQQIAQAASALVDRPVELSLNPEELGRVRLTLRSHDGNLAVNIVAERPETLAFLRRHIDQLATQLRELGYQELTFEFADQRQQFANDEQRQAQQLPETVDDLSVPEMPGPTPVRIDLTPRTGVDIRL